MTVLHILLGILKIAGILLAVLLGLLLLILRCVLFCPVVYQGVGEKNQDRYERKPENFVAVSWNFFKSMVRRRYTLFCADLSVFPRSNLRGFLKGGQERKPKKNSQKSLLPCRKTEAKPRKGSIQGKAQGKLFKRKQKKQKNKSSSERKVEKKRNRAVFSRIFD